MRELTYWEKSVWLTFNPSGDEKVTEVKELCAKVIDLLNDLRADQRNEQSRLLSVAITEMQTAQMRAVKWITWKD